jgi:hypothetical protein
VVVRGLTNGIRYRFEVTAVNRTGASDPPGLSGFVRPATVPSVPRIGTAAAGATGDTATTATARWSPPQNNGGANVTGYRVTALRMSSTARNARVLRRSSSAVLPPGSRSRALRLTLGVYRFQVVARNSMGNSPPSARSNAVRAR